MYREVEVLLPKRRASAPQFGCVELPKGTPKQRRGLLVRSVSDFDPKAQRSALNDQHSDLFEKSDRNGFIRAQAQIRDPELVETT